jgi:hypothetical protein
MAFELVSRVSIHKGWCTLAALIGANGGRTGEDAFVFSTDGRKGIRVIRDQVEKCQI